jgi:hypothetical protein
MLRNPANNWLGHYTEQLVLTYLPIISPLAEFFFLTE